jgi:galactose mutarotase-like enzyme
MPVLHYQALPQDLPGLSPSQGVLLLDQERGLEATVAPASGGEVSSLVQHTPQGKRELLYRANDFTPTAGWQGRAPLLWPAVGRNFTPDHLAQVASGQRDPRACSYQYGNQTFNMPIHGFAMIQPWTLLGFGADSDGAWATCELTDNDTTQALYPFAFNLRGLHRLATGELVSRYSVRASLENPEPLFFSIGNHLSFQLPFANDGRFEACVLTAPTRSRKCLTPQSLLNGRTETLDLTSGKALADPNLHNLVVGDFPPGQTWVELQDPSAFTLRISQQEIVPAGSTPKTSSEHFYFVFWGNPDTGLYCPEPWYGGPNSLNTRQGLIFLEPGETFVWEMRVTIKL